jgi:hypothetical protein
MNRLQFWILNGTALALTALLLGHFFFAQHNDRLGEALERDRAVIADARQAEAVLDQLAKRIAVASKTEPQLKSLLVKYGLSVTLETDGRKIPCP